MKLAAYLRVSTDAQAEHGLGVSVQRETIEKWARKHGHKIVLWAADEGVSGSNGLDGRDALPEALAALREGVAAGLVVYRLDRLARDLVLQEQLLSELRKMGAEVFSTAAGEQDYLVDDPDDPSRKLIRQILGAVNEYERAMIRLRLRSGRRRKHTQGGYAYGGPPYGWQAHDRELVPVPAEQAVIARIVELRAQGSSLRQIAATLAAEGHPPRRGDTWRPNVLAAILTRAGDSPS